MKRIEEIALAAERLAETKRTEEARNQCLYDFQLGAEWADQTMIQKACDWLRDDLFVSDDIIQRFKQVMTQ